jgi:glycosyltransferase involved in cell wall biosynthesis
MLLVASPAYPEPPIDGDKFRWTSLLTNLGELTPMHGVFGFMTTPTMEARDELFDRRFASLEIVNTPTIEVALRAGLLELGGRPSAFGRRATPRWREAVAAAAARHRPASILLLGTSGGYVPPLPAPTWLDLIDVRSRNRTRSGDQVTRRSILTAELALAQRHRVLLTSDSDRDWLVQHGADGSRVAVVPNGVDASLFELTPSPDSNLLLFVGNLRLGKSWRGLQWFLRECWPTIHDSNPTVRLRIVGYGADRIRPSDRLEVYANVPAVRPHYAAAAVTVAPLLEAGGVQNKALEAMAAGLPVVCTSPVARGFFNADPAWEVADDPAAMAKACLSLLASPARRAELGERGRRYVRAHHDWAQSARSLLSLLSGSLPPAPHPRRAS